MSTALPEDVLKSKATQATEERYDPDMNVRKLLNSLDVPKYLGNEDKTGFPMVPTYLDMFEEENLNKYYDSNGKALPEARIKLKTLFLACRAVSVRTKEDYFVRVQSPIMRLLAQLYPGVPRLDKEPDGGIRLSDIVKVIETEDAKREKESTGK
jgi:hypothetical protein